MNRWTYLSVLILVSPLCLAEDEKLPSIEFLEYLGEWQDDSGAMIDPLLLGDTDEWEGAQRSEGESQ